MELTIYDKNGKAKAKLAPNDSSTQQKELQGDNVLTLSFTHWSYITLDVNDWCDFQGERYWLQERYAPKEENKGKWTYDVKLYGVESLIKRFLVLETTDGDAEPVFTLTAPPADHVKMIVKCLNDGMGNITDWKVGQVDGTDNIVIDYEGKYCDEALKEIAEAVGGDAEWWIEGTTINICRCEHGEPLTIGYGNGLTSLERDTSNTSKFYTRLFPIGSTRNIDAEKYGHPRLMLPDGKKYVEIKADEYGIYDHYEQEAFSGIYPRRVGTVSEVRKETKRDDDGNNYEVYYFKDSGLDFDPNDYELAGEVKRVSFQSGELAGLGDSDDHYFEVNYDSGTKEFEIITIWPYDDDTQLPGGSLVPKVGDQYILWNIRMPDEYYTQAEQELQEAVEKYNAEHWKDISVYKGPTNHVWVEQQNADLYVGRRVRLESTEYFTDTGYRLSRITKLTRKVTLPSQVDLEISDALATGTMQQITDSIGEVKNYTRERTSTALPDIVRSWDNTPLTDNNLLSARRSMQEFLSKKRADRAKKRITFDEGIGLGDFKADEAGGELDGKGNGELLSLIVRTFLRDPNFQSGFTGKGWKLWMEDGLSRLEIDRLTVRQIMTVFELIIDRIRAVGGQIVVSAANGKIKTVEDTGEAYRLTFEDGNYFEAHDLLRCQVRFTGNNIRSYWVEVASVDGDSVTIAKSEFADSDTCNTTPLVGDEVVLFGNTENTLRQNLIRISATEDGQPRIDILDGVKSKNYADTLRTRLGNLDGISDPWFGDNQPHGNGLYADNAYLRGTFLLSTGEDVKTRFEAVEGKIASSVEALRQDFVEDRGFLSNATFGDGLSKWQTESNTIFWLGGGKWIWANGSALSKKGDGATLMTDDGRIVVRLRNGYIVQKLANMRSVPSFAENSDGEKEPCAVYVSFMYRCTKAGVLKVGFEGVDKTGFVNFNSLEVEEEIAVTDGYRQWTGSGLWNGTGNFKLNFTGEMMLYLVVLSTDRVEALTYKYRTLLEQSETLVKIAAQNFDQDGNVLAESDIITTSKYNELISAWFNDDGSLKNSAGLVTTTDFNTWKTDTLSPLLSKYVLGETLASELGKYVSIEGFSGLYASAVEADTSIMKVSAMSAYVTKGEDGKLESGVYISAEQIKLEGLVTANETFKINTDGSMEATAGTIGGFTIGADSISSSDGWLKIGSEDFNTRFGITSTTKKVSVQANDSYPYRRDYNFAYKENNRLTLGDNTGKNYNWENILVANVMDIDYFSGTTSNGTRPHSYGFQFAMLGSGHVALDGIVEGGCLSVVDNWSADRQVQMMTPPLDGNRVAVKSDYENDSLVLPDLYSVLTTLGYGITHDDKKKFSFRIDVVNTGEVNTIYVAGRNTDKVNGEQYYKGEEMPVLYYNESEITLLSGVAVKPRSMATFLLVYDGSGYYAYTMK